MFTSYSEACLRFVFVPGCFCFVCFQADLLRKGRVSKQGGDLAESWGVLQPRVLLLNVLPGFYLSVYLFKGEPSLAPSSVHTALGSSSCGPFGFFPRPPGLNELIFGSILSIAVFLKHAWCLLKMYR